jgi:hypothetical protein
MKSKTLLVSILIAFFGLSGLSAGSLCKAEQKGGGITNLGKNNRTSSAAENRQNEGDASNTSEAAPEPLNVGGETSVSPCDCEVLIVNHTRHQIRIYVDGYDCGVVNPWSSIYCYTGMGWTRLYGITYFSDGDTLHWGTHHAYCTGFYRWDLYN